jgi:negative regulator of replication initiation
MIRTQISLDEETYREIKHRAYLNGESMASVIRRLLKEAMSPKAKKKKRLKLSDFKFIGSVTAGEPTNTAVEHDEVLGEGEW